MPPFGCGAPDRSLDHLLATQYLADLQSAVNTSDCAAVQAVIDDGCLDPAEGTLAPGMPCADDEQCAPVPDGGGVGSCFSQLDGCTGVCSVRDIGQPCDASRPCIAGYCDYTIHLCAPFIADGGACDWEASAAESGCDPLSSMCNFVDGNPVCQPRSQLGGPCYGGPCLSGQCLDVADAGFVCVAPVAVGAPCAIDEYGESNCPAPNRCLSAGDAGPVCVGAAAPGEPCRVDAFYGSNCPAPNTCLPAGDGGQVCLAPAAPGQACVSNGGVWTSNCQGECYPTLGGSGLCLAFEPAPALGDACDSTQQDLCAVDGDSALAYCSSEDGSLGSCAAVAQLGQSCGPGQPPCFSKLVCVNGACAAQPAAGQPCGGDQPGYPVCLSGDLCIAGTCTTIALEEQTCTASAAGSNCLAGYCDPTAHCAPFLASGAACDPSAGQCSAPSCHLTFAPDGGPLTTDCVDPIYLSVDGGGHACASSCPAE